jgi:hypothetical protein
LYDSGDLNDAEIERLGGFVSETNSEYIASDAVDADTLLEMAKSGEDITSRSVIAFRDQPEWAEGNSARLNNWRDTVANYNDITSRSALDSAHVQDHVNNIVFATKHPDVSGTSKLVDNTNNLPFDAVSKKYDTHGFRSRNFEADMATEYAEQSDVQSVEIEPNVGPPDARDVDLKIDRGDTQEYAEIKDKTSTDLESELVGGENSIQNKFTDPDNEIHCGQSDTICSADIRVRSDLSMTEIRTKIEDALRDHDEPIAVDRLRIHTSDSDKPTIISVDKDISVRDISAPQNAQALNSYSLNQPTSSAPYARVVTP